MADTTAAHTGSELTLSSTLHNALLLLGYTGGPQAAPATEGMFDKASSKTFETVLHFLLSKLRGAAQARKVVKHSIYPNLRTASSLCTTSGTYCACIQDFQGLWPIKDVRQQKEFRKVGLNC